MNGLQAITGKLNDALGDVRRDIVKIEILATALAAFSAPIPDTSRPENKAASGLAQITCTVGR